MFQCQVKYGQECAEERGFRSWQWMEKLLIGGDSGESNNHNNGAWIPSFNNIAGGTCLCAGVLVSGAFHVNDVVLLQINQIFYIAY